jgi:hypothetical protein
MDSERKALYAIAVDGKISDTTHTRSFAGRGRHSSPAWTLDPLDGIFRAPGGYPPQYG